MPENGAGSSETQERARLQTEDEAQAALLQMLLDDHARMRAAGCELAAAAIRVIGEYDGLHRLSLAVAGWAAAVANEGGREAR